MLNWLTRTPEPVKRLLRAGFVRAVRICLRVPGMRRAAAQARRLLPEPYQWLVEHYAAYRILRLHRARETARPLGCTTKSKDIVSVFMTPPKELSVEERHCFTRLVFAANARRTRVLW